MIDFLRCLVGMFAVIAPFGALATLMDDSDEDSGSSPRWFGWASVAAAFAVLVAAALLNRPVLDALNISPESFQFAAGAAMAPLAVRLMLTGNSMPPPTRPLTSYAWLVPLAVPMLAGPSSIIAAMSYAARFSEADTMIALAIVAAFTTRLFRWSERSERYENVPLVVVQTAARLSGGLLVLIAVELAIDGVHSV